LRLTPRGAARRRKARFGKRAWLQATTCIDTQRAPCKRPSPKHKYAGGVRGVPLVLAARAHGKQRD
jgi:hypothetical protein